MLYRTMTETQTEMTAREAWNKYQRERRQKLKEADVEAFRKNHREKMLKYIHRLRDEEPEHYHEYMLRQQVSYWRRKKRDLDEEKFKLHFTRLVLRRPEVAAKVRSALELGF